MPATAPPPRDSPFGPIPSAIRERQKAAKKRMLDLDLDRPTLAARLGWTPEHLSSVLNTGIRRLADPNAALDAVDAAIAEIAAEAEPA